MDRIDAHALPGSEGVGGTPFWSPDSRTVAFFQAGKLKTIASSGGPVQTVCDTPTPARGGGSGTWSPEGTIVFASGGAGGGLFKVPAAGGHPLPLTKPEASRRETSHRFPHFLSDGRRFLFQAWPANTIWIGRLDGTDASQVLAADSQVQYSSGDLLFVRQGTASGHAI